MVWEMAAGPFSDLSPEPWLISKRGKPEFANNSTTDKRQRQKGTSWNESYHTPLHVGNILFQVVVRRGRHVMSGCWKGKKKSNISPGTLQQFVSVRRGRCCWDCCLGEMKWGNSENDITGKQRGEEPPPPRRGKRTNEKKAFHGPKVAWFPGYSFR